ncbi:MAG: hypothetical protein NC828_04360 [Candidatus Omnitrophica bacterium]|nr:hypothetical protein [Candidatus Omnitrophota bacterium]
MWNYYTITSLLTTFIAFSGGLFVYSKGRNNIANKMWLLLGISVAVWSLCFYLLVTSADQYKAFIWDRILHSSAIFIPVLFLHFVLALLGLHKKRKRILIFCYIFCFSIQVLNFSPLFIESVIPRFSFNYYPQPGILYFVFLFEYAAYVIYALIEMLTQYRNLSIIKKNQVKYIIIASIIGFSGGFTTFPWAFNIPIPPVGIMGVSLYTLIITYAIVRYRLMDIEVVLTRAAILAMVYVGVIGVTLITALALRVPLERVVSNLPALITLSIFALLSLSAPFTYLHFQQRYDDRRLASQREQFSALKQITQGSLEIEDLGHLLKIIPHFLMQMYQAKLKTPIAHAAVYFYDATTKLYIMVAQRGREKSSKLYLSADDPLIFWFTKRAPSLAQKKYFAAKELTVLKNEDIDYFLSNTALFTHEAKIKEFLDL